MIRAIKEERPKLSILGYRMFYADRKGGGGKGVIHGKVLRCERHGLSGKPDFIFKRGGRFIPVELKSASLCGKSPREGDIMQLVCYFLLVHAEFGKKPRHGRLIYKDTMFLIRNSRKLRKHFLATVAQMRHILEFGGSFEGTLQEFAKCRYCICRETVCGEKI